MNTPIHHKTLEIEQAIINNNQKDFDNNIEDLRSMIRRYCQEKGYYNHTITKEDTKNDKRT